jgi:hypothetical protein
MKKKQILSKSVRKGTILNQKKHWVKKILGNKYILGGVIILIFIIGLITSVFLLLKKNKTSKNIVENTTKTTIQSSYSAPPIYTSQTTKNITTTTPKTTIPTTTEYIPNYLYELIFSKKYQYDGIQNIQFSDYGPRVYLKNPGDIIYFDVKFTNYGSYSILAEIDFNNNQYIDLQVGIIYPGYNQYPKEPIAKTIKTKQSYSPVYYYIGDITLLETQGLIQPIFIKNMSNLSGYITIDNIKVMGNYKIEYPYTEWWNKENNTGKRPFQHANNTLSNSIFDNIPGNIRHAYKEMIIFKSHIHTYATAINGPATYMGIDFMDGRIVFSVWNANINGVEIQNEITDVGNNVESNKFDHEGNGSYFTLRYSKYFNPPLEYNYKYGFYNYYKDLGDKTEYTAYFINLGPIDNPYKNPVWILIGKVMHYASYNTNNRIGGFVENYMTANGHLYQRSYVIGNGWASVNGIDWYPSTHEEAVLDDLTNQQAEVFGDPANGLIRHNIGGRLGMSDIGLTNHGNLRAYDVYRNVSPKTVPTHIKSLMSKLL